MKRLIKILVWLLAGVVIASASGLLYLRHCEWNPEQAVKYATENAEPKSVGLCALYVRKAINAGGIPLYKCGSAWHYRYVLPIRANFMSRPSLTPSGKKSPIILEGCCLRCLDSLRSLGTYTLHSP